MPPSIHGRVVHLEIARGHDGLFRGPPDPVLVFGIYACAGPHAMLVGRSLHRFSPREPFPSTVTADVAVLPGSALGPTPGLRFVVLAVALEEDGGKDVQRLYGVTEHHRRLSLWASDHDEVDALAIGALTAPSWSSPRPVELLFEGTPIPPTCSSDKWIGAVAWVLPSRAPIHESIYRLPFLAPNQKNDWTAIVCIAH